MERLFSAIADEDAQELDRVLAETEIAALSRLAIEFELHYGESPLHLLVKLTGKDKRRMAVTLISCGALDCNRYDRNGNTAVECAVRQGERDLAIAMLQSEMESVEPAVACRRLIQRSSLKVFQLFLEIRNWTDAERFQHVASALVELNVRNVKVQEPMRGYTLWILSDYGYRELSGDYIGPKDANEWKEHVTVIDDNMRYIKANYDVRNVNQLDSDLLHRLQIIHNRLYFIKDKRFARHLPMMEVTFCLAIFISIYRWEGDFDAYRLALNKRNVLLFLDVICSQLVAIKICLEGLATDMERLVNGVDAASGTAKDQLIAELERHVSRVAKPENVANRLLAGLKRKTPVERMLAEVIADEAFELADLMRFKHRRTFKALRKFYKKVKQFYSVQKILSHVNAVLTCPIGTGPIFVNCMKRMIQVIGESIKDTDNSPNMPTPAVNVVIAQLTALFPQMNKTFREILSHSFQLSKLFLHESYEESMFNTLLQYLLMVRAIFQMLLALSYMQFMQIVYGTIRGCRTTEKLRAQFLYVGDIAGLSRVQHDNYLEMREYFTKLDALLRHIKKTSPANVSSSPDLQYLEQQLQVKINIVTRVGDFFLANSVFDYADIRRACFGGAPVDMVHRLVNWKLSMNMSKEIRAKILVLWKTAHMESLNLEWFDGRLLVLNPATVGGILKNMQTKVISIQQEEYMQSTRNVVRDMGIEDGLDDGAMQELNSALGRYYENIFRPDNQFKILKQFFKNHKLTWNEKAAEAIKRKCQTKLQEIFDDRQRRLQCILAKHNCLMPEFLGHLTMFIPRASQMALDYCQLELCEMLIAVGYFGDSFYYLKHRISMMQGRNYRNYLAHDSLSYNLLTESNNDKTVINAYVMANTKIQLFRKPGKAKENPLQFPTLDDSVNWLAEQRQLFDAMRQMDLDSLLRMARQGVAMEGEFCGSVGPVYCLQNTCNLSHIVDPINQDERILGLMDGYFPEFTDFITNPQVRLIKALERLQFEDAFQMLLEQGCTNMEAEFFAWPELAERLHGTSLYRAFVKNVAETLPKALEYGNAKVAEHLLSHIGPIVVPSKLLEIAILNGMRASATLLLEKSRTPTDGALIFSTITHFNEIIPGIIEKCDREFLESHHLTTAVLSQNVYAVDLFLSQDKAKTILPHDLERILNLAIRQGNRQIVERLLATPSRAAITQLAIDKALNLAIQCQRWSCVQPILDSGASMNGIDDNEYNYCRTPLQGLVKFGCRKLISRIAPSIDRTLYVRDSKLQHPLSIAIHCGGGNERIIRFLLRQGFDWWDSSHIFREVLQTKHQMALDCIFAMLERSNELDAGSYDIENTDLRKQLFFWMLLKWKAYGYLHEPSKKKFLLLNYAAVKDDVEMVRRLLNLYGKARTVERMGAISFVAFRGIQRFHCDVSEIDKMSDMLRHCQSMIDRVAAFRALEGAQWQSLEIPDRHERFIMLRYLDETSGSNGHSLQMEGSIGTNRLAMFDDIDKIVNNLHLAEARVIHIVITEAKLYTHFLQVNGVSCIFDILRDGSPTSIDHVLNYRDHRQETLLHRCFPIANPTVVRMLLEHGANPLAADMIHMTPLHLSLLNASHAETANLLLNHCLQNDIRSANGTPVTEIDDGNGGKLIQYAVMGARLDIVQQLLEHKVNVTVQNPMGLTPAMLCVTTVQSSILKIILAYDASSINMSDKNGMTLLHYSVGDDTLVLLDILLQYGVDFTIRTNKGMTAFERALAFKKTNWIKSVLQYATANGIKGLTTCGDNEVDGWCILLSINDADMCRAALEYELGESLDAVSPKSLHHIAELLRRNLDERLPAFRTMIVKNCTQSLEFIHCLQGIYNSLAVTAE